MTNAHSKTGQMAVCCQNLMLGALSSQSALSLLVGVLFKWFCLFLNMPHIMAVNNFYPFSLSFVTYLGTEVIA